MILVCVKWEEERRGRESRVFIQYSGGDSSDGLAELDRAKIGGMGSDILGLGPPLARLPTGGPMVVPLASPLA